MGCNYLSRVSHRLHFSVRWRAAPCSLQGREAHIYDHKWDHNPWSAPLKFVVVGASVGVLSIGASFGGGSGDNGPLASDSGSRLVLSLSCPGCTWR